MAVTPYYRFFGLERDPFLDTADPYFYCEIGALRKAKERIRGALDASRGLTVVLGEPGTGKTSLCAVLERELLDDERFVLGKLLDPTSTEAEFLVAVGRVFGLSMPRRSNAALKNALKNFFFESVMHEKRTPVLVIDEAQTIAQDNLEALRLLLNYQIPERKLLNIVLFGQNELEAMIHERGNLSDRVDSWIRLGRLDRSAASAILEFRLARAGGAWSTIFSPEASALLFDASEGLPRRLTMVARAAMEDAADRASARVNEEHVRAAMLLRGISERISQPPMVVRETNARAIFARLFARRA